MRKHGHLAFFIGTHVDEDNRLWIVAEDLMELFGGDGVSVLSRDVTPEEFDDLECELAS